MKYLKLNLMSDLKKTDEAIYKLVQDELHYEQKTLRLIPSENYASKAVLEATGSVFANKYAEGYPHKRYYAGQKYIDMVEDLAIERAKKLFGVKFANVQLNSGSPGNMAVYYSLMNHGDTFMGLELSHGGHITHGLKINFSGSEYNAVSYQLNKKTEKLDFDEIRKLAEQHKPKLIVCGYTAYPYQVDFKQFREICDEIGAYLLADISHIAGLIVGGVHPSPVGVADVIMTTTHKTLRGPRGAVILTNNEEIATKIDKAVFPGLQGGPHIHSIAAKAVCFHEAMQPEFKNYTHQIVKNAKALAHHLSSLGLRLVGGGTETHLILVDVMSSKNITGKKAHEALEEAGIIVNKNTIPYDTQKPFIGSGIRIGTPSLTTRGMKETEMKLVAELMVRVLDNVDDAKLKEEVRKEVEELCSKFPIY